VTHIILPSRERSQQHYSTQAPECCCKGQVVNLATGCWLTYPTQRWFTSAEKSNVPSLLQRASISASSDLRFNLSTAKNDHHQQRTEMKCALSFVSQTLFAVSLTSQIFNFNFNEVALFDKG